MTTDHGGINQTKDDGTTQGRHGGSSDDEMNVFLAVCDPGITPNSKIEGKVVNMDCAAIILKALGVEIPKYFDAKLPFSPLSKFTIRSGGQTGVDQGALDAALDYNEKTSESFVLNITGKIPEKYPLIETKTSEYEERTKLNVRDADATLIILLNSTTS
ncbi:36650_t:CDS:2, partial [Racocetra persica]